MTTVSQEVLVAAWICCCLKEDFLNINLARVPITPKRDGTIDMRDEVLSSVGAYDMDTIGYQVSDLDDVEFYCENDQFVSVFRPWIDTPFPFSILNDFEIGSRAENPMLIDKEQDKENYTRPYPTTPISEKPTELPLSLRSCPLGTTNENVPDYIYTNLFEYYVCLLLCMCFNINYN